MNASTRSDESNKGTDGSTKGWLIGLMVVLFVHFILFGAYSAIDVYWLMTHYHNSTEPNTTTQYQSTIEQMAPEGCDEVEEVPLYLVILYSSFNFFNFVLLGSWLSSFLLNYRLVMKVFNMTLPSQVARMEPVGLSGQKGEGYGSHQHQKQDYGTGGNEGYPEDDEHLGNEGYRGDGSYDDADAGVYQINQAQYVMDRRRQVAERLNPLIMFWLHLVLVVDAFGLALDAFFISCLRESHWKVNEFYSDFFMVFFDYLALVIYPVVYSTLTAEPDTHKDPQNRGTPFKADPTPMPPTTTGKLLQLMRFLASKTGLYLLLFVLHAIIYLTFWIIDLKILYSGDIFVEPRSTQLSTFFFMALNCINFYIIAAWLTTFTVAFLRGASIKAALLNNFAFFLILMHYLLFTDAIGLAIDAFQFSLDSAEANYEFVVDFLLGAIDFLSIIFYPRVFEGFFPLNPTHMD